MKMTGERRVDSRLFLRKIRNTARKTLAIHLSAGLLLGSLGFGMARGDERNKPVYIGQQPGKQTTMVLPAEGFSLAPGAKNGFTLARASQPVAEPEATVGETTLLASPGDLGSLLTLPFIEPLVQIYQTLPWDMMAKDAKPAEEKKSPWWKWPLIIVCAAAAAYGAYEIFKPKDKPIPKPDYTVTVNVINHMLGLQKTLTRTGKQGTQVNISPADWSDVTNINPSYWAVRENNFGKYIADFKDSNSTYTVTIGTSNITCEVRGANSTNNAPYAKVTNGYAQAFLGRNAKWRFVQGDQEGSKDLYVAAINQIRQAIKPSWGPAYGEITEVDSSEQFNVKFNSLETGYGSRAGTNPCKITVDLAACARNNMPPIRICIEEIVELLGNFDDIAYTGTHSSYLLITGNNGLNALGADLISWEYARDRRDPVAQVAAANMQQPFNQTMQSRKLSVERIVDTLRRKPSLVALLSMLPVLQQSAGKLHFGADMADQGSAYVGFGDKDAGALAMDHWKQSQQQLWAGLARSLPARPMQGSFQWAAAQTLQEFQLQQATPMMHSQK